MSLKNTENSFGQVSKLLHWSIAICIFLLIGLGLYLENAKITLDQLYLFGWHKAFGMFTFVLILIRLSWTGLSPPPKPLGDDGWQMRIAHFVHRMFYLLMIAMPLTGWIASSASGFPMNFFGLFPIPAIAPESEWLENLMFAVHGIAGKLLIVLILLHIAGGIQRQLVKKDGTLRRMWF